jgi:hypothetical protein
MSSERRRRSPDRHVLVASGDDLVELRMTLALLPANAYGTVIVDTPPLDVNAPSRMTVTQVRPGALDAAVQAWVSEWMPEEGCSVGSNLAWMGRDAAARLDDDLRRRLVLGFEPLVAAVVR